MVGDEHEPSYVPALWGIRSMREKRTIIDNVNNVIYLCGPGDVRINVPAGITAIPIENSPSKHPMVVCTAYEGLRASCFEETAPAFAADAVPTSN